MQKKQIDEYHKRNKMQNNNYNANSILSITMIPNTVSNSTSRTFLTATDSNDILLIAITKIIGFVRCDICGTIRKYQCISFDIQESKKSNFGFIIDISDSKKKFDISLWSKNMVEIFMIPKNDSDISEFDIGGYLIVISLIFTDICY